MRFSATLGLCMYSLYGLPFFAVSARGVDSPQKMEARIKCADNHRWNQKVRARAGWKLFCMWVKLLKKLSKITHSGILEVYFL